ncbi:hypothetical protein VP01_7094g1 [Puccinia sorghi]|uniref:Uncharacterized protein n=1 Tax=Puccinia sorghi TaxID=27349 RepID=A0A0L6UDK1_9BASI|nr:hypothetical protein VP01_7094g1 [Puccinia sorghi]
MAQTTRPVLSNHSIPGSAPGEEGFNQILSKFNNSILFFWINLHQEIPWTCIKDPYLLAALNTVNLDQSCSNINGLQLLGVSYNWTYKRPCSIAGMCITHFMSKSFYCDLLFKQATNSYLTLIHDVRKKGNHFGFIGESVSFIDNDWN